jgi:TRAP transporter 4TM/12TM fusion protein
VISLRRAQAPIWLLDGKTILMSLLAVFAFVQVCMANFGSFAPLEQRGVFVGTALGLVFLGRALSQSNVVFQLALIALATIAAWTGYHVALSNDRLMDFMADLTLLDKIMGVLAVIFILEATRTTTGLTLPIVAVLLLSYLFLGNGVIGGYFEPPRFSILTGIETLYGSTSGIFGFMTDIGARVIAVYVVFGALLMSLGAGHAFIKIASMIAGRSHGGAAKVSVISSALFGTVSGSAVANVMAVGAVTIPTMTRSGYPKSYAAGVEATASAGGQILPPVMGAGAFLMAEFLNVPFSYVALAALPPALLYFGAIFLSCDMFARRLSLGVETGAVAETAEGLTLSEVISLTLPVIVLGWLLFDGYAPTYSGSFAIVTLLATTALLRSVAVLRGDLAGITGRLRSEVADYSGKIFKGLVEGGRGLLTVAILLACSSILVSGLTSSGLALKVSDGLIGLSGEYLFIVLVLAAITSILMGMDVPTTASYVLTISVVGPSLIRLGLEPISAHLFVFYFAILSAITPPVCASVYAAAIIAQESFWKVAGQSLRIAGAAYFIPFMFVYRPGVLGLGTNGEIVADLATTVFAVVTFSAASIGYLFRDLSWACRTALYLSSGLLFIDNNLSVLAGFGGVVIALVLDRAFYSVSSSQSAPE